MSKPSKKKPAQSSGGAKSAAAGSTVTDVFKADKGHSAAGQAPAAKGGTKSKGAARGR